MAQQISIILVVTDCSNLSAAESAIHKRLSEKHTFQVLLKNAADGPAPSDAGASAVVVCASSLHDSYRTLSLPLLTCRHGTLFGLGMILADPKVDFGVLNYTDVLVYPTAADHPLARGLTGRHQITTANNAKGWAKPGALAVNVATIGGDSSKSVVFGYGKGCPMAALPAPDRRTAFLALGDDWTELADDGWLLFDAALVWTVAGGGTDTTSEPTGQWFLKDGSPSRTLSAQEYRDWVHDRVSANLFKWCVGLISFFGGAGVLWTVFGLPGVIKDYVKEEIKTKFDAKEQAFKASVQSDATEAAGRKVIELVFNSKQITEGLVDAFQKKANEFLDEKLADPVFRSKLTDRVVQDVIDKGSIIESLIERVEKNAPRDRRIRHGLINQIALNATEIQWRQKLRPLLQRIIADPKEDDAVRITALGSFQLTEDPGTDERTLLAVIDALKAAGPMPLLLQRAFGDFIACHPDTHIKVILDHYMREGVPVDVQTLIRAAVVRMPMGNSKQPKIVEAITSYLNDQRLEKNKVGIDCLRRLLFPVRVNLSKETRYQLLSHLFEVSKERVPIVTWTTLSLHVADEDGVFPPTTVTLPSRATQRSSIFVGLLRHNDGDYVNEKLQIRNNDNTIDQHKLEFCDFLLFNWAEHLESSLAPPDLPAGLIGGLLSNQDLFRLPGAQRVLIFAMRKTDRLSPSRIFAEANKLPLGKDDLFTHAVDIDRARKPPLKETAFFLGRSEPGAPLDSKTEGRILTAVQASYASSKTSILDLVSALREEHVKRVPKLHKILEEFVRQRIQKPSLEEVSKLIDLDPYNGEWHLQKARILWSTKRDKTNALASIGRAIELDPNRPEFLEFRGDIHIEFKETRLKAFDDYEKGIAATIAAKLNGDNLRLKLMTLCVLLDKSKQLFRLAKELADAKTTNVATKLMCGEIVETYFVKTGQESVAYHWTENQFKLRGDFNSLAVSNVHSYIRYLSAKKLNKQKEADDAFARWARFSEARDLLKLLEYFDGQGADLKVVKRWDERFVAAIAPGGRANKKPFTVALDASKYYQISMVGPSFDSYLYLYDSEGKEVNRDDDSGGNLDARMVLRPPQSGEYRIEASHLGFQAIGPYTVIVREIDEWEWRSQKR